MNEADKRGMGAVEGHRADVGKVLTGAAGEGARGAGRFEGADDPGIESLNVIFIK